MKFSPSSSSFLLVVVLCCTLMVDQTMAFARGSARVSARPVARSQPTEIFAAAAGGAKKKVKKLLKKGPAKKSASGKPTPDNFKKAEFIAAVAEKTGLTKADAERSLNAVLETITENVANGKRVSLVGFGTFQGKARAARVGRNPQTGEPLNIPASISPGFSASKNFKQKCN